MLRWLRSRQPGNPFLAVIYWLVIVALALALLVVIFFQLDRLLPAMY